MLVRDKIKLPGLWWVSNAHPPKILENSVQLFNEALADAGDKHIHLGQFQLSDKEGKHT
jgi:hypothetical protein